MRADQARQIPAASYLASQGVKPEYSRKGGKELWYISPIRSTDNNPSFKIDTSINCWYDYGIDQGGNTLDLAIVMLRDATVSQALKHLEATGLHGGSAFQGKIPSRSWKRTGSQEKEASSVSFEVVEENDLQHPALLRYVHEVRGIDQKVAQKHLRQITYKQPESASKWFGVGYPAGDGFEARNALWKGFVGSRKDISFMKHASERSLLVFEGFMDFLTYLTLKRLTEPSASVIVLNSGLLADRAREHVHSEHFDQVQLFLDNDELGDKITAMYLSADERGNIEDMRKHYQSFGDLNEWHLSRL